MLALLALFGPKQGLRIPLAGRLTLGRGADADLQLVDGKVSREHCRIDAIGVRAMIEDLGSQNGTYVNGELISRPTPVAEGDEIMLGDTLLLVAGDPIEVANARYGAGTLLVSSRGRASTAVNPGSPLPEQAGRDGTRELGALAARLAAAGNEEDVAAAVLDAIESELAPKRATLLLRVWQGQTKERVVALATRGEGAVFSISRTLLERAATSQRGILVEDAMDSRELRGVRSVVLHTLRSVMVMPWGPRGDGVHSEGPRGFIHVDRAPERPFTSSDLAWLEAVGHLVTLRLGERPRHAPAATAEGPVGASPTFVAALGLATSAAHVDSTVLLLGETGTGKEEIARLIHSRSPRNHGPFVAVNCGAVTERLAESDLFGHEKGDFAAATRLGAFEAADGGTLFLDEIGDLSSAMQAKLLRVLQERAVVRVGAGLSRQVDVRIVAATHRDLADDVKEGLFRADLFSRINVLAITLPPLRDRRDDIALLARVLLDRIAGRLGLRSPGLTADAETALAAWEYPGNVPELANVLERILVLRDSRDPGSIDRDDVLAGLGRPMRPPAGPAVFPGQDAHEGRLADAVARLEKGKVEAALRRARGVKSHAARILGVSRPALDKKIADLNIDIWAKEIGNV